MKISCDVAVIGSGFGGAITALIARQIGLSVVLLERGKHPRFAIGESSTPLANLLFEELAERYSIPWLSHFSKWGTWQQNHPEVACGLKRGFTFYHHTLDEPFLPDAARRNELMVAASPRDRVADTHWYRPDFDAFLADRAAASGAEYLDETEVVTARVSIDHVHLACRRKSHPVDVRARLVLDATGPRGALHQKLALSEVPFKHIPRTEAVFAHFENVSRWSDSHGDRQGVPYPPDDAAVHHVFPGGWIWILRFNNGLVSAGAALTRDFADQLRNGASGAPGSPEATWDRLLDRLPSVRQLFRGARNTVPFGYLTSLSFRSEQAAGSRWALLPSAAGFVDPLLSTGFPLTLLGISRLGDILAQGWEDEAGRSRLTHYAALTFEELDRTERLVAALYANLNDFEAFSNLTRLYFAAASFTETARRLRKPELAGGKFLLGDHGDFERGFRVCVDLALRSGGDRNTDQLRAEILRTIEPVDVAGLGREEARNWHPVDIEDLFAARQKLGVSRAAISDLCRTCF